MRRIAAAVLFVLSLGCTLPALAQEGSATLTGLVQDSTKAVIPGVKVTAIDTATNQHFDATTSKDGSYSIVALPVGPYQMQIEKPGFKTILKEDIFLHVQDALQVNFQMAVGSTSESVTVSGAGVNMNTTDGSVSTVIDRDFVQNMPLNGRSFQDLILLSPGVVTQSSQATSTTGYNGDFSVNGQRTESNNYTIDGVSANTGAGDGTGLPGPGGSGSLPAVTALGTTQGLVSVDALEEFRVQSSTYSAEFGRNPGGQFSLITRSGTNEFHGSTFDYLRNNFFDANNWFNDYYGVAEPPLRQNDFGGTLGGHLWLPHLYDGKNKTFFFVSYEGLMLTLPQAAALEFVPSVSLRQNAPAVLQPILNAFPKPTPGGTDYGDGLASFNQASSSPARVESGSVRIDHNVSAKLRIFLRFGDTQSYEGVQSLSSGGRSGGTTQSYTVGASSQLSSTIDNEFRIGYSKSAATENFTLDQFGNAQPINLASAMGIAGQPNTFAYFELYFPGVGSTELLTENASNQISQWNPTDTLRILVGHHHLSLGVDFRRIESPLNPVNPTIEYVYESENSIQNNSADVAEIAKSLPAEPVFHEFALFAQDEWSVQPNLSLSLGLRWDVNPPPSAGGDGGAYTVLGSVFQPSTLQLAPPGTPLWHTSWHNFAPRLGAARVFQAKSGWETVIRGGAGVFFDTGNQQASRAFAALGYHASSVIFGVPIPVPANQLDISPSVAPPYAQIYVTSPHLQLPYTFQWNLSAEQSLGGNRAVTASYVAAAGRKLLEQQELNLATLNPTFPSIVYNQNGHGSNYQSLQLQYQQQITHGIQALGSYTWSHAIDFGSTDIALPYIRGNSDLDVRQNFEGALSWALPGRFSQRVTTATLAGWGIDARVMARSGFPITLNGNFLTDAASGSEYYGGLNLLPNQPIYLFGSQYPGGRAINKSAFSLPTTNEMGDAPRNFVRGFDAVQANLAVRKEFPLFENIKLQFRAEAFNVLNHPIFGQIDSTYTDLLFGQADATLNASLPTMSSQYQQGGSRSMQFALKLVF